MFTFWHYNEKLKKLKKNKRKGRFRPDTRGKAKQRFAINRSDISARKFDFRNEMEVRNKQE